MGSVHDVADGGRVLGWRGGLRPVALTGGVTTMAELCIPVKMRRLVVWTSSAIRWACTSWHHHAVGGSGWPCNIVAGSCQPTVDRRGRWRLTVLPNVAVPDAGQQLVGWHAAIDPLLVQAEAANGHPSRRLSRSGRRHQPAARSGLDIARLDQAGYWLMGPRPPSAARRDTRRLTWWLVEATLWWRTRPRRAWRHAGQGRRPTSSRTTLTGDRSRNVASIYAGEVGRHVGVALHRRGGREPRWACGRGPMTSTGQAICCTETAVTVGGGRAPFTSEAPTTPLVGAAPTAIAGSTPTSTSIDAYTRLVEPSPAGSRAPTRQ